MTYQQLISNAEQMEAHWRDFEVFWNMSTLQCHFAKNDILRIKQGAWLSWLADIHADLNFPEGQD